KEVLTLGKHPKWVNSVAYSPDGKRLASGSTDGTIKVWEADTGQETLAFHHPDVIMKVAFSPDRRLLAAAASNRIVKVWDVTTRQEVLTLRGHKDTVWGVAFSPEGGRLASGRGGG